MRGIRIGTAEVYRILGDIEEILEAMAVEQQAEEETGGTSSLLHLRTALLCFAAGSLGRGIANG